MDFIAHFYRRDCEEQGNCEKPTSHILTDAVPAAVTGFVLLVAGIVIFIIARRKRKLSAADDAKERESLEIDLYDEPSHGQYQGPAYGDPFSNSHSLSRDPDYNEFSLAPPTPRRDRSPAKSFQTESIDEPHSSTSPPPAYSHNGPSGREAHPYGKV